MPKTTKTRDFIVGAVFLGSLAIIAYATLWLERAPWKTAYAIDVRFPTVDNLRRGEPVLIHGVQVGQVEDINYGADPSGRGHSVLVRLSLDHDLSGQLTEETIFSIRSAGPLGGRILEIRPQPGTLPQSREGYVYNGKAQGDVFDEVSRLAALLSQVISENRISVKDNLEGIHKILASIDSGEGLLGALVNDKNVANDGRDLIEEAKSFVGDLRGGEGLLTALVQDPSLKKRVVQITDDVGTAVSPESKTTGVVAALLHDEEMRQDLRDVLAKANKIADSASSGEGLVAALLKDREMREKAIRLLDKAELAMSDVQAVTAKINRGEGFLGKLIHDEAAWDEVTRILVIARESLEDLREQAPISSFTNVLFSAF